MRTCSAGISARSARGTLWIILPARPTDHVFASIVDVILCHAVLVVNLDAHVVAYLDVCDERPHGLHTVTDHDACRQGLAITFGPRPVATTHAGIVPTLNRPADLDRVGLVPLRCLRTALYSRRRQPSTKRGGLVHRIVDRSAVCARGDGQAVATACTKHGSTTVTQQSVRTHRCRLQPGVSGRLPSSPCGFDSCHSLNEWPRSGALRHERPKAEPCPTTVPDTRPGIRRPGSLTWLRPARRGR